MYHLSTENVSNTLSVRNFTTTINQFVVHYQLGIQYRSIVDTLSVGDTLSVDCYIIGCNTPLLKQCCKTSKARSQIKCNPVSMGFLKTNKQTPQQTNKQQTFNLLLVLDLSLSFQVLFVGVPITF